MEDEQFSPLEPIVKASKEEEVEETKEERADVKKGKKKNQEEKPKKAEEKILTCSACGQHAVFSSAADQRSHFKTEWHV